jgi:hypothetical protein
MKKAVIILLSFIIIAVLGLGILVYIENKNVPGSTSPEIDSFSVENQAFLVKGNFLTHAEIWYDPVANGENNSDPINLGSAILQSTDSENNQIWSLPIPAQSIYFKKVFASGVGKDNQKAKNVFLEEDDETDLRNSIAQILAGIPMIGAFDDTRTFSYTLHDKIILKLEENKYPQDNISIEPLGNLVETTTGLPEVPLPFYAMQYELRQTGSSTISNGDFKIYINGYLQNGNKIYENPDFGFKINYPPEDILNDISEYEYVTGRPLVRVDLPHNEFIDTNLYEAALMIGASRDSQIVRKCGYLSENEQKQAENLRLNGIDFMVFNGLGAAAGNRYETTSYRTVYDGICYELVMMFHYGEIGNYEPGVAREFDHQKALDALMEISNTFSIQ